MSRSQFSRRIAISVLIFVASSLVLQMPAAVAGVAPLASGALGAPQAPICHDPTRVGYIDAEGNEVQPGTPGAATVYSFGELGDGSMIVPPADFSFATSSDAQLLAWGYPPRDDGSGTDWTKDDGLLKPQTYDSPSTVGTYPGQYASNIPSGNWSGVEAYSTNLRRVYGEARVPTFNSSACTGTTALALWTGIGNSQLIQNGWFTHNGAPQDVFPFWEVLAPGGAGVAIQGVPGVGYAGDLVKSDSYLNEGISPIQIQFNWTDVTTGVVSSPYLIHNLVGDDGYPHTALTYYDGSQAEAIDEKIGSTPVRSFSVAGWTDMYAVRAGTAAAAIGSYSYNTSYIPGSPHSLLALTGGGLTSSTQMNIQWGQCS